MHSRIFRFCRRARIE